jgi:hypothetical protein
MDRLLAGTYTDPDNARLANRLRKLRGSLFTFLYREEVEATNNRVERELRPAVIARKLSAGNRTEAGAETHAVLVSLLRTCRRHARAIVQTVADLLHHGPGQILDLLTLRPTAMPTR